LNLLIPVPAEDSGNLTKWPVMIWLYGGWFQMGEPSHEICMDPTELISTGRLNAIIVAVGYRLNVFGFLAGDALTEEGKLDHSLSGACGNYGLWDQKLAIDWI
jgi:carboxylesterase type B